MLTNRYHPITTWDGIWQSDPIPSHGMGADPHIPYHPISFRPLDVGDAGLKRGPVLSILLWTRGL